MSRENVELVQGWLAAYERDDLESAYAALDPEIEWDASRIVGGLGLQPSYRGHEGVREYFREWYSAWETVEFTYEDFIDAGDNVVVILSQRGRGRTSGAEVTLGSYALVLSVSGAKIARAEFFRTPEEALEAVGLRE